MVQLKSGQILTLPYKDSTMRVIVIDPNGMGLNQPTLGMGFNMTAENLGLPKATLSDWTKDRVFDESSPNTAKPLQDEGFTPVRQAEANTQKVLTSPSGRTYQVMPILDETGNTQLVIEGADWVDLACDVSEHPGRVKKTTLDRLNAFVRWCAKKGFYATVYAQVFGAYTLSDDNATNRKISELQAEVEDLTNENALLDHRYSQALYQLDSAGLLENQVEDGVEYYCDWDYENELGGDRS